MHILQLHNSYQMAGGEDVVVANEASLLRSYGHHVDQLLASNHAITDFGTRIRVALSLPYSAASRARVAERIAKYRPDVVHVHNTFPLLTPSVYDACIDADIPIVQTLHNYRIGCINGLLLRDGVICQKCWTASPYWGAVYKCYRNSRLGSLAAAHAVSWHRNVDTWNKKVTRFIALTDFAREKFIDLGIAPEKIVIKANFAFDLLDESPRSEANNRARRGALFVGRLTLEKGLRLLLKAWNTLSYPLTIIGEGPLLEEVRALAGSHIDVRGRQNGAQVRQAMREAAFLVLPSIWLEQFPMVIVEALASGLPVLCAAIGGLPGIIGSEGGRLFQANSVNALRDAATALIEAEDECNALGLRARSLYERLYSPQANYQSLRNIYEGLI